MALTTIYKGAEHETWAKHIIVLNKSEKQIATVMCDSCVYFEKVELGLAEINQITTIANNFTLFYDNIQ